MLPFEVILDIVKYLDFRDRIELKKTRKLLDEIIKITYIPCKYWDKLTDEKLDKYSEIILKNPKHHKKIVMYIWVNTL